MLEIINRRRNRGLTAPINADVLGRASISPSLIPRTLQALQTLDLINEAGEPTPVFENLRLSPEAEFKERLGEWLKGAYAEVFSFVDPSQDDEIKIKDAFRSYNPVSQQPRMITLFKGLCSAAGLMPEKRAGAAASSPAKRPAPAASPRNVHVFQRAATKQPPPPSSAGLPPAIAGLMASLPSPATGWTAGERQKFLTTFQAVVDYAIPVVTKPKNETDGHGE
jgi:hypothetical protein